MSITMSKQLKQRLPQQLEKLSKMDINRKSYIAKMMTYTLRNLTSQFIKNGFE